MGGLLAVAPRSYEAASLVIGQDVAVALTGVFDRLTGALSGCAAMSGSDPAGERWAHAYDATSAVVLGASQDVVNACYKLAGLLEATGFNYGAAESASTPGGPVPTAPDTLNWDHGYYSMIEVPTAAGGSGGEPALWWLIRHSAGYVWPNGHQDRLRAAAAAWRASSAAVSDLSYLTWQAIDAIQTQTAPEVGDAVTACTAMQQHLHDLASAHATLGAACDEYAGCIDRTHSRIEQDMSGLLVQSIGIELAGAFVSAITGGTAEGPTQSVEGWRVRAAAAEIGEALADLLSLASTAAANIADLSGSVARISMRLQRLLGAEISPATTTAVDSIPMPARPPTPEGSALASLEAFAAAAQTPPFSTTRDKLRRKFKHAAAFGVSGTPNVVGIDAFRAALALFISSPSTVRVLGAYLSKPAVLNYDTTSHLVVVQRPDGSFVTCWKMTAGQYWNVVNRRSLGGH